MLASQHAEKILKALGNGTGSLDSEYRELLDSIMAHLRESDTPSAAVLRLLRHVSARIIPAASVAHA